MKTKRIFITGVNGFLGQALSERLLNLGHRVHGLTEENEAKTEGVIPHKANLLEYKKIGDILEKINPDIIIHLAARTEVEKSFYNQVSFSEVNYCGTVNLIEQANKSLPNLELFLFASTMETYGAVFTKEEVAACTPGGPILKPFDELTEQKPNAPYAVAKLACEKYLEYAGRAYNFPYCALRQTNAYGRHDNDFFVVEQFITQMLDNPDEANFGYAEPYRNFLFVDDLIDLYCKIIENTDKAKGEIFCTGPDNAVKIEELANIIAKKLEWKGKINWGRKPNRPGEIYYLNSTNEKAKSILSWEPKINLSDGLDKTIQVWKDKKNAK